MRRRSGNRLEASEGDLLTRLWIPRLQQILDVHHSLRKRMHDHSFSFHFRSRDRWSFSTSICYLPPDRKADWPHLIRRHLKAYEDRKSLKVELKPKVLRILGVSSTIGSDDFSTAELKRLYTRVIKEHGDACLPPTPDLHVCVTLWRKMLELPLNKIRQLVNEEFRKDAKDRQIRKPEKVKESLPDSWDIHHDLLKKLKKDIRHQFGIKLDSHPSLSTLEEFDLQRLTPFA